jgi:hypothetical protein
VPPAIFEPASSWLLTRRSRHFASRCRYAEATLGYAANNSEAAEELLKLFSTPLFAVELVPDLIGVDLCGALKNCITLSSGFCVGQDLGMNVRAAILRKGHQEIRRFARGFFPVRASTFDSAAGIGDLILSCIVGRGQRLAEAFVRAGGARGWEELEKELLGGQRIPDYHNVRAVHAFLSHHGRLDSFPILKATYEIAHAGAPAASLLAALRCAVEPMAEMMAVQSSLIDLSGRRAMVVGAAGGIGRAIVEQLLRCGARVLAVDMSVEGLEALRAERACAAERATRLDTLACDLGDMDEAMAAIGAECAKSPVQYVVFSAGLAKFEPFHETSLHESEPPPEPTPRCTHTHAAAQIRSASPLVAGSSGSTPST